MSELKAEDVARYLQENPIFFEEHAELLAQINVPHPHGGQAIPLSDRQILGLREKTRALEAKLAELIQFGEENDVISERVHRLAVAMLAARTLPTLLHELYFNLREDFAVPHAALRLWRGAGDLPEFQPVSDALREYAAQLAAPFCGPNANFEAASWFGEATPHIRSVAFMPLRELDETFGMLALAAEDLLRFYPEMGTLYLKRMGEMASAALLRFV
ncbi:MAG TPA: DUF484 family protein [Burkholderiales bacterium]|nr:DUF484 family protein [Burkholderiales bacterium]